MVYIVVVKHNDKQQQPKVNKMKTVLNEKIEQMLTLLGEMRAPFQVYEILKASEPELKEQSVNSAMANATTSGQLIRVRQNLYKINPEKAVA